MTKHEILYLLIRLSDASFHDGLRRAVLTSQFLKVEG